MPGDVDTATAAPTAGQLVWNNGASKFEPVISLLVSVNLQTWTTVHLLVKVNIQLVSDASGVELVDP